MGEPELPTIEAPKGFQPELPPTAEAPKGFKYVDEESLGKGRLKYILVIGIMALVGGLIFVGMFTYDRFYRKYYALGISLEWSPDEIEGVGYPGESPMEAVYPTTLYNDTRAIYRVKGERSLELRRGGTKQFLHAGQEGLYLSASSSGTTSRTIVDNDILADCKPGGTNEDCNLMRLLNPQAGYYATRYIASGNADQDEAKSAGYLDNCSRLFDLDFEFADSVEYIFGTPVNSHDADDFYVCLPGDFSTPPSEAIDRAERIGVHIYTGDEKEGQTYITGEGELREGGDGTPPVVNLEWDFLGRFSAFNIGTAGTVGGDTYLGLSGNALVQVDCSDYQWTTAVNQLYFNTPYTILGYPGGVDGGDPEYLCLKDGEVHTESFPATQGAELTKWKIDRYIDSPSKRQQERKPK